MVNIFAGSYWLAVSLIESRMQGCKWAGTHRNGVPVGTFAAGTPFLFGINLLPKRSPPNGTKICVSVPDGVPLALAEQPS